MLSMHGRALKDGSDMLIMCQALQLGPHLEACISRSVLYSTLVIFFGCTLLVKSRSAVRHLLSQPMQPKWRLRYLFLEMIGCRARADVCGRYTTDDDSKAKSMKAASGRRWI